MGNTTVTIVLTTTEMSLSSYTYRLFYYHPYNQVIEVRGDSEREGGRAMYNWDIVSVAESLDV